MSKSSSIYARVEPELKDKVEQVLSKLGIPMANAINMFLNQIVLRKGIPFDVTLPQNLPLDYSSLSKEQFDIEIEKGFASMSMGKTISAMEVRENMQRQYKS